MKIYDISVTISPDLPVWPGDPPVSIERVAKIEDGANANVSKKELKECQESRFAVVQFDQSGHIIGLERGSAEACRQCIGGQG